MTTDLEEKTSKAKKSKKFKTSEKDERLETHKLPKWKTLEKITVLLTSEQRDAMDDLARTLCDFALTATYPKMKESALLQTLYSVLF